MNGKIEKYLPSPNFRKMIGILLLVVLVILGISKIPKIIKKGEDSKQKPIATLGVGELVETDTDGDGLKDWEEPLWGMDPENRDTNGDGVSDGEEISKIKDSLGSSAGLSATGDIDLTQTETFSQQLFSLIAALQENGELTDQSEESIIAEIGAFIQDSPQGTVYYMKDIKTVPDTSANAIAYIKAVDSAFIKYPIEPLDFILFDTVVTTPNTKLVNSELKEVSDKYKSLANTLLATPVVVGESAVHLALLNSIVSASEMFGNISRYAIDPIPALASAYQSNTIVDAMLANLETLNQDITDATSTNN